MPAVNAVQSGNLGQTNAFIAKFDPTGTTILYSTYLGGSQYDYLNQIAVDSTSGNLIGVGFTYSPDFPLVNPVQPALGIGRYEDGSSVRKRIDAGAQLANAGGRAANLGVIRQVLYSAVRRN
jgi:hypothetical protein